MSRITRRSVLKQGVALLGAAGSLGGSNGNLLFGQQQPSERRGGRDFRVRFAGGVSDQPYTGRVYVFFTRTEREPRLLGENWFHPEPLLARDVENLRPGDEVVLSWDDDNVLRDPLDWSQFDLEAHRAQAVVRLNPWERTVGTGPGNAYSRVVEIRDTEGAVELMCDRLIAPAPVPQSDDCRLFSVPSPRLSRFYGREVPVFGLVQLPASYRQQPQQRYPVLFEVPGFGGTAAHGFRPRPVRELNNLGVEFIRVMLDPSCPLGHHVFADSANNGPWGTALVSEFLPALAAEYRTLDEPRGRLLTGHSSGGWSSLWLQVNWPEVFGGVWSTAPDPVDFRDFQRINLYRPGENMYVDLDGARRPLARQGEEVVLRYDDFCRREDVLGPGGQLHSFEACFSPRGPNGHPRLCWDRTTGDVDPTISAAWTAYDVRLVLEDRWKELAPKLATKLHIHMGTLDTFYLDGACGLLKESLRDLDSDAIVELHPGKDHGSLMTPQLRTRLAQEMAETVRRG